MIAMIWLVSVGAFYKMNVDDFFKLPNEVQRGFISQFKLVLGSAIYCGTHYNVFGDSMTVQQFRTIKEIVRRFENEQRK